MKKITGCILSIVLFLSCQCILVSAEIKTPSASKKVTQNDVLSIRNGKFYLDGAPFAEISFNKFDLMWSLYDELRAGRPLDENNAILKAQERALINLKKLGFRSVRVFAYAGGGNAAEKYLDPEHKKVIFEALDKIVELCEKHRMGIIWSLCAGSFINEREDHRELCSNPNSENRKHLYDYLDFVINRYKNSPAVFMWEITNELTLTADLGDKDGVCADKRRVPTLKAVAQFYHDVAKFIKVRDPLRLVNNGGSVPRESQWNLYVRNGWKKDTYREQQKCFDLLFRNSAVDVVDIHYYLFHKPGVYILGDNGKERMIGLKNYKEMAGRSGKPIMIGEIGRAPAASDNKEVWGEEPNYFKTISDTQAALPWIQKLLDEIVDSGIQLTYWWMYQSDREMDLNDPMSIHVTIEKNPEIMMAIIDANRRLKKKHGVEIPKEIIQAQGK